MDTPSIKPEKKSGKLKQIYRYIAVFALGAVTGGLVMGSVNGGMFSGNLSKIPLNSANTAGKIGSISDTLKPAPACGVTNCDLSVKLDQILDQMNKNNSYVVSRFSSLDSQLTGQMGFVAGRFTAVDDRLTTVLHSIINDAAGRFTAIDNRLTSVLNSITMDAAGRFTAIDGKLNEIKDDIAAAQIKEIDHFSFIVGYFTKLDGKLAEILAK